MTIGNEPNYFPALDEFSSNIRQISEEAITFSYKKMEDENHRSIPYLSVFKGLRFVFTDWQLPLEVMNKGLTEIDNHYKTVSEKYGYEINTPENVINRLGYNYLQNQEISKAIEIFSENVKRYPKSGNVYDSLGEAYENDNQLKLAEENYLKAWELGKLNNEINTPIYKRNLDRVRNNK
jgi:tetratricopeptide (TPR) repeat protein